MKVAALIAFFAAICFSQDAQKPVCNAKTRGQFWPPEANTSPDAARRLTQSGEIEMCSQGRWRYKWEHLSVTVRDLAKSKNPVIAQSKTNGDDKSK
jgi:hypothetical protein